MVIGDQLCIKTIPCFYYTLLIESGMTFNDASRQAIRQSGLLPRRCFQIKISVSQQLKLQLKL